MISIFHYPTNEKKRIQNQIKKYPSIRFEENPFDLLFAKETIFKISGNVYEMDSFAEERWYHGLEIGFYKKKNVKKLGLKKQRIF